MEAVDKIKEIILSKEWGKMLVNKTDYALKNKMPSSPKTAAKGASFAQVLQNTAASAQKVEAYRQKLEAKFGPVAVQNVGRDQESLEAVGRRMNGRDIIIAPNILTEMALDKEKAAYYEQKIRYFFTDVIPNGMAFAAARGLVFQPGGVVIHPDGSVTYVCGGEDSPERRAQVEEENRAKQEKRAAKRRLYAAKDQQRADEAQWLAKQGAAVYWLANKTAY